MADRSQKINKFTDDMIQKSISVNTDYDINRPELVYFVWKIPDSLYETNHKNWQCFDFITSWLKDNDIWFSVSRFSETQCEIYVHSREAQTMLKLTFDVTTRVYQEDIVF